MKKGIFVLPALLLCLFLSACRAPVTLEAGSTPRIEFWDYPGEHWELTAEEVSRFVALYSAAAYGGKAGGSGTTPEYGFAVYLNDGTMLRVNDFGGRRFEVTLSDTVALKQMEWFYVDSEEPAAFAAELLETCSPSNKS